MDIDALFLMILRPFREFFLLFMDEAECGFLYPAFFESLDGIADFREQRAIHRI
jgi:hypothetical protein